MEDEKIYSPRIDWYGGECPVPQNTLVKVKYRDGVDGDIVDFLPHFIKTKD